MAIPVIYDGAMTLAGAALALRARLGDRLWRERLVLDEPPAAAAIWVHGASLGELTSARPLIAALARDHEVSITANSVTGRDMARGWGLPARLAPLDAPGPTRRFLAAMRPRVQITIEGEFWPVRSRLLAQAGVPQVMIGARISERSARRWARMPRLIAPMLGRLAGLSAQDAASEARLLALGLPRAALLPPLDLKLLAPAAITPPPASVERDTTWLAASTHEGEEALILDAHLAARAAWPGLRLILAPRHPDRADAVAALIEARGLSFARRSAGADAGDADLLLADTLGEMARWYAAAGICLTGGSLTDRGGHTPWEPAAHRCAILHGPHVANFTDSYAGLDAAHAARPVTAATLGDTVARLAGAPGTARAMGDAALAELRRKAGDPSALLALIGGLARQAARTDIGKEQE